MLSYVLPHKYIVLIKCGPQSASQPELTLRCDLGNGGDAPRASCRGGAGKVCTHAQKLAHGRLWSTHTTKHVQGSTECPCPAAMVADEANLTGTTTKARNRAFVVSGKEEGITMGM